MLRDATDRCRVPTQPLVVKNRKPLHGWFAAAVLLAGALASSGVIAANGEQFCTHGGQNPQQGDSVACYSDAGCRFAATLGADPVWLRPEQRAVCSRARQDHRHHHVVFRLDG
jgi:hypothetical protein